MIRKLSLLILLCAGTAAEDSRGDAVDIREWLVPWAASGPSDPVVGPRGRVWFISASNDFIGNFSPVTAEFNRYDLRRRTKPAGLLIDANRTLWFMDQGQRKISSMNPGTGRVSAFEMPQRRARDPRSITFDRQGNIWFTVSRDNFVGQLNVANGSTAMLPIPIKNAAPFGIIPGTRNELWIAASGVNLLLRIDTEAMSIAEFAIPDENARPRRLAVSSDGRVWYADYERGRLGRFDPVSGDFAEWLMPGGDESRPFGMTIDRNDRLWIVETSRIPNRLVEFDTATGTFRTETDIPSGGGSVGHLFYHEESGEIWFATQTNYIGRAIVH